MAGETDLLILSELQKMSKAMKDAGNMGAGGELKSRGQLDKEEEKEAKRAEKVAATIQKQMLKSSNATVRAAGKYADSLDNMRKLQEKTAKWNKKEFESIQKWSDTRDYNQGEAIERLKKLGLTLEDLDKDSGDLDEAFQTITKSAGGLDDALRQTEKRSAGVSKAFNIVKVLALAAGKQLYEVTTASMRSGVDMTAQGILQARMMGMSQAELIETQGQYRNAIEASGMSSDDFSDMMEKSAWRLFEFTGSLKEGAAFAAETTRTFRNLGAAGETQASFMREQEKSYKNLHSVLSITTSEFKEMNSQMLSSQSTREQLFKMDRSRRATYFLEMQAVRDKLLLDGLSQEATMKVIETMNAMGAKSPKDRLKEAAKIQALAGAMGMGAEGAEMARLQRGGLRNKGDKDRYAELAKQLTGTIAREMGSGDFGREMTTAQLLETLGLTEVFGPGGAFAETALAEGRKPKDVRKDEKTGQLTTQNSVELKDATVNLTAATQALAAAMTEGPMAALSSVLTGAGFLSAMKIFAGGKIPGFGGPQGGVPGSVPGATTKATSSLIKSGSSWAKVSEFAGKHASKLTKLGGVLTAGFAGYNKYDELKEREDLTTSQKTTQVVATGAGAGLGAIGGAAAGALIGSVVPVIGTIIGGLIGGVLGAWGGETAGEALGEVLTGDDYDERMEEQLKNNPQLSLAEDAKLLLQEQIRLQKIANEQQITGIRGSTMASNEQVQAVINQTQANNINYRKYGRGAPRVVLSPG